MFMQGELNVTDYCRKMKTMVDTLQDLGYDVFDHQLVVAPHIMKTIIKVINP
jgi:hypothetical protein